jgi:hypothetical protein
MRGETMNLLRSRMMGAGAALLLGSSASFATPLGTSFTYQGQLESSGLPLDGTADVIFGLFDAAAGGTHLGNEQVNNVTVEKGLFTAGIDFGAATFNGDARWLEIAVRIPAGGGVFTVLSPRQALTATPYALQTRGIFVDSTNRVGIGTTSPQKKLSIAGDMELGTHSGDYRHFRIGGGNCSGFLYGSYPAWGDGIHMGYNYYADAAGIHKIIASDGQTSRLSLGYGYAALATGGTNQVPVNRLTVTTSGNVGLGTDGPAAKLEVRGNVKLGSSGQYYVPAGEENLRVNRGIVDGAGTVLQGSGFLATRLGAGAYRITFTTLFGAVPSAVASVTSVGSAWYAIVGYANTAEFYVYLKNVNGAHVDGTFSFCVVGPR